MWNLHRGILFLLFSLLLHNSSIAQNYWLHQISPTGHQLSRCFFADSLNGWAAGDSATIIHTSNNGLNWIVQTTGFINFPINEIFFTSRTSGWALCNDYSTSGTFVMRTTNGGTLWTNTRFSDTNVFLNTIYFTDSLTGYVGAFNSKMFKTTNAGLNWDKCVMDTTSCYGLPVRKINFQNSLTGYACGGGYDINGQVWKTTNAGGYWSVYCLASEPMFDIVFQNNNIFTCGGDFEFGSITGISTNNGVSWSVRTGGCFGIAQYMAFRTPAEVWMPLGFSAFWAVNTDSGTGGVWQCIHAPDSTSVFACQFTSSANGWAFGTHGAILKYNTGVIGIAGNQNNVPQKIELFQNYPNPFNPVTKIKFNIPAGLPNKGLQPLVQLKVYDALGREAAVLLRENLNPGTHEILWDASAYPSGVYFYKLVVGDYTVSKKMLLIK